MLCGFMATEFVQDGVPVSAIDGPYVEDGQLTPPAVEYVARLINGFATLREYAADRLMTLYNNNWLDENHTALDRPSFLSRLVNPSITLYDELGAAVVYFEDDNMFAGHYIEVRVNNGVPEHAGLAG
jgi:hypothetical protein